MVAEGKKSEPARPVQGPSRESKMANLIERYEIREGKPHIPDPYAPPTKGPRISEDASEWNEEFSDAYSRFMEAHEDLTEEEWDEIRSNAQIGTTPDLAEAYANKDYDWFLNRSYEAMTREREAKSERAYANVLQRNRLKARGVDIDGFNAFLKSCEKAEKE